MILLTLNHVRLGALSMEVNDHEERLFSSKDKAEQWLINNGFFLAPRTFFKGDPLDWCREGEFSWDHIEVGFQEIDSSVPSRFKELYFH